MKSVTITVMGQFTIEADTEEEYEQKRDAFLAQCEKLGLPLGIESEDTNDGTWFDDDE